MQIFSIVLLIVVSSVITDTGAADDSFDVVVYSTRCPTPQEGCVTLAQCLQNTSRCFASNVRVHFVEGLYEIGEQRNGAFFTIIGNVNNLTLKGNGSTITCVKNAGFAFMNITKLTINNLMFNSCGEVLPESVRFELTAETSPSLFQISRGT